MWYLIFLISFVTLLSSCTWWNKSPEPLTGNLYPSIPLGASGEAILLKNNMNWKSYTAKGTEPFWSANISASGVVLSRPGNTGSTTQTFITEQDDKGALVTIRSIKGDFFINLTKWSCSDGMSDIKYTYNATVLVGADTLKGCATE